MDIFKFATTKPPVIDIWKVISNTHVNPLGGYSANSVRFIIFVILQLTPEFKEAKALVNSEEINAMVIQVYKLLNVSFTDLLNLELYANTYPNWVDASLYTPYYTAKQLFHKGAKGSICFETLFDRTLSDMSKGEGIHIDADMAYFSKIDTTYQRLTRWMLDNVPIDYYFIHTIQFDITKDYLEVSSKDAMEEHIKSYLIRELDSNDILEIGTIISMPQFKYYNEKEV